MAHQLGAAPERHGDPPKPMADNNNRKESLELEQREQLLSSPLTHPNGVSIFPNLSTVEQSNMSYQALDQAEGAITADSEVPSLDGLSDDGYGTESGASSGSASLDSSVRDYMYENGRRYHRFKELTYHFPNEESEQEREDMQHAMMKLLCAQKLFFAPIGQYPHRILDIGTGTGIWAIEMADQFSGAEVLGIDLSPIQPEWLPPNARFMIDDVEAPWLYPSNHFDFVHSRHTVMAIKHWPKLLSQALEHLEPGGWMELQEIHHKPLSASASGVIPTSHPISQYWSLVSQGLDKLGVDLHTVADGRMAQMMQEAGFTNVTERVLHIPLGTWPKNKVLKAVGLYWRTILIDGLQAIALGPLTRGLKWDPVDVEMMLVNVRKAYYDSSALVYMQLHLFYGQKPMV